MLTVVCWRWKPPQGYRSSFGPETVNVLRSMVRRHYPAPHRFVCVTDDATGIEPDIELMPMFTDFADVPSPHGGRNPSCYRRLRMFHPDAAQWFGGRFVAVDLDCVITGDMTPVWDRPEDLVMWGDTNPKTFYNGSMLLMSAGCRPQVWDRFDPQRSPHLAKQAGCFGSDQGWISYCLGSGEAKWTTADGVYSYRNHIAKSQRHLPENARIVLFHGNVDPWGTYAKANCPWIAEHYQ